MNNHLNFQHINNFIGTVKKNPAESVLAFFRLLNKVRLLWLFDIE